MIEWISNPYAYGAIGAYINGKSIGGISNINGLVKGYIASECIYEGNDENEAMLSVENAYLNLPKIAKLLIER